MESQERYSFRIIGINEDQIKELKGLFKNYSLRCGKYFENNSIAVICLNIDFKFDFKKLVKFIKKHEFNDYGVWISFEVLRQSDGFTVPSYITDLISEIGGTLDVSTLCLIDEDID